MNEIAFFIYIPNIFDTILTQKLLANFINNYKEKQAFKVEGNSIFFVKILQSSVFVRITIIKDDWQIVCSLDWCYGSVLLLNMIMHYR